MRPNHAKLAELCRQTGVAVAFPFASAKATEENPYALSLGGKHPAIARTIIKSAYDAGARVFLCHRPFGETLHRARGKDRPMELDAGAEIARDPEWFHVIVGYHAAREWMREALPEAIVIDYLGTIEEDLLALRSKGDPAALLKRLLECVSPCLSHPNVWIGLDASSGGRYRDGEVFAAFAALLDAAKSDQGCGVVVEALPNSANRWAWEYPAVVLNSFFREHQVFSGYGEPPLTPPVYHVDGDPNRLSTRFASERVTFRWLSGNDAPWMAKTPEWKRDFLTSCLYYEHTPMLEVIRPDQPLLPEMIALYRELRETHPLTLREHRPEVRFEPPAARG